MNLFADQTNRCDPLTKSTPENMNVILVLSCFNVLSFTLEVTSQSERSGYDSCAKLPNASEKNRNVLNKVFISIKING